MAKTNKMKIMALCDEIQKKEGAGSIFSLGSKNSILHIPRWSTGIEDLDNIIGGGMPEGRIIEIFGPESSGKTSLAYHLSALHPLALNIPIEGTFDSKRAQNFGNKPKQLLIYRAKYGEQAMNQMTRFAQAGIPLIILDSIPACKPKEDYEKVSKDVSDEARMGGVARLMHKELPSLEQIIEVTGTTIILINQVRDKMNALMFGEKTDTPGGRAPKFYSSIRIQVARRAWIEIPNKDPRNSANTEKIGMIMKCKVVKSKVCNPMGECEIPLFFERNFQSFSDMKRIKDEIYEQRKQQFKHGFKSVQEVDDDVEDEDDE